jgi:hypothetical protein
MVEAQDLDGLVDNVSHFFFAILPPRTWDKALTQNHHHQQQQQKQCWVVHMLVRGT